MANFNTRVQLKYDSFSKWQQWYSKENPNIEIDVPENIRANDFPVDDYANKGANLKLNAGEVAFCTIPAAKEDEPNNGSSEAITAPTVLFKVGDGTHRFFQLKWASALAADVHSWAKMSFADFLEQIDSRYISAEDGAEIEKELAKLEGIAEDETVTGVISGSIDALRTELIGEATGETIPNEFKDDSSLATADTIIGAKEYANKLMDAFLTAFVRDNDDGENDVIDKLKEIADWITTDETGAADLIASKLDKAEFEQHTQKAICLDSEIIINCGSSTTCID